MVEYWKMYSMGVMQMMLNKITVKQKVRTKFGDYTAELKTISDVKVNNYDELWEWLVGSVEEDAEFTVKLVMGDNIKFNKKDILGFVEEDMHDKETSRSKKFHNI